MNRNLYDQRKIFGMALKGIESNSPWSEKLRNARKMEEKKINANNNGIE